MTLVGHVRGGLGYVGIMAAIIMAALSGSAVADAAALAALLLPMMDRAGYDKARSAGLLASASIIAPIIPPSIGFVIFGVAANVSISKLFLAGIAPGLMLGAALWVTWWWLVRKEKIEPAPRASRAEVLTCPQGRHLRAGAAGDRGGGPEVRRVHADRSGRRRRGVRAVRLHGGLPRAEAVAALRPVRGGRARPPR